MQHRVAVSTTANQATVTEALLGARCCLQTSVDWRRINLCRRKETAEAAYLCQQWVSPSCSCLLALDRPPLPRRCLPLLLLLPQLCLLLRDCAQRPLRLNERARAEVLQQGGDLFGGAGLDQSLCCDDDVFVLR